MEFEYTNTQKESFAFCGCVEHPPPIQPQIGYLVEIYVELIG